MTEENLAENAFVQEEIQAINDLETLKVISDSLRLQIVEVSINQSRTVKQIAKLLGTPTTKLYYHVNQLEEYGILKVVSTRIVSGVIEKQYKAAARSFTVNKSLLALLNESDDNSQMDSLLVPLFDITREEVRRSLRERLIDLSEDGQPKLPAILSRSVCYMTKEQATNFRIRLTALLSDFANSEPPAGEATGHAYAMLTSFYPIFQPNTSETDTDD